jgi:hypothetical protein
MIPKPNSTSQKRLPLSSKTKWLEVQERLTRAMGYDDSEEDNVSLTYRFSKDPKQTRNSLEDNDDYQGIIETLRARRASAAPIHVIIFDNKVCPFDLDTIHELKHLSQTEEVEHSKTKKPSKKEIEIAKAKATASAQSEVDDIITELKLTNPVCAEHRTHCWIGHPSKEHVTVTEIRFWYWATEYVCSFPEWVFIDFKNSHQLEHQKLPKDERKVTLDTPPNCRMFDVPQSNQKGCQFGTTPVPTVPNIVINFPDWASGQFSQNSAKHS